MISSVSMPCSRALRPASSAATCAAYGVDLRLPLKPWLPEDDQAMALPWASVIVTIVLLKLASTCATPEEMFFRSFLRGARAPPRGSRAMLLRHLLLAGNRHRLALAGPGIGVG